MTTQIRETLEQAELKLISAKGGELIVKDETGKTELWHQNDGFAGYALTFGGHEYEFVHSNPNSH